MTKDNFKNNFLSWNLEKNHDGGENYDEEENV